MSNEPRLPSDFHSELIERRLIEIADLIRDVRRRTVDLYEPEEGDGAWSLGTRVYERTINKLDDELSSKDWFKCERPQYLSFLMYVGSVPIKYKRDKVDSPSKKSLQRSHAEIEAIQMMFPFGAEGFFWRIFVETDLEGYVLRTVLAQFDSKGTCSFRWDIPEGMKSALTAVAPALKEGVNLPPPSISLKKGVIEKT